jgi:RNA polymerase sigma factor (sigma-70 family)
MPRIDDAALRRRVDAAVTGDAAALEEVVAQVRDDIYRLAVRMLWHPHDAEDATQEALIRLITRIGSYRGEASFRTWAYRVTANHIMNWRRSRVERENLNFRRFGEDLDEGLAEPDPTLPEANLLAEEVKLGCTLGMLMCLDREHRLAYVLSDVFQIPSTDGAYICGTSATSFRKRASRARAQLRAFVSQHCGLVEPAASCRCDRRIATAVARGRVRPDALLFAQHHDVAAAAREMEHLHDLASLMRSHPDYKAPGRITSTIKRLIESGDYNVLG